jgi:hypothetical protein
MHRVYEISFLLILLISGGAYSQEEVKRFSLNGYVSTMESVIFDSLSGPIVVDNLLHNRLNFKGYINEHITFATEFRNRLFTGDIVRTNPAYSETVGSDDGLVDLSWNILDKQSFLLNTSIDRLWADFNYGKFQARLGRQRINWGQTLVWNPNDIFNVYSYFDFDYIERPGSDAIRLQYYPDYSSSFEIAIKADYENNVTGSALYRFNTHGYDIQFLAGYFNSEDIVAGTGWSGAIGSVSFRGEATWFQPAKNFSDTTGTGIFTIGFDKTFGNNSMAQMQVMYCNKPADMLSFGSIYSGNMSTKELAFSEFSAFGSYTFPITPLFNVSLSAMWFPDLKGFYAGPFFDYSIAENIDLSLYWQHFESKASEPGTRINMGFLRVKISF